MSQLQASNARQPRLVVKINDVAINDAIEAEVTNTSHFRPDAFHVVLAITSLPADKPLPWWSNTAEIYVEVFMNTDDTPYSTIYGQVDDVDVDLVGGVIVLTGRDMSAGLLDTKTSTKYQNQTSSQIATQLATKHGLKPIVADTKTKVGKFYQLDHVALANQQTEWDMLIYLAQLEGFNVWVAGKNLYFQPTVQETANPYRLTYTKPIIGSTPSANVTDIKLKRSLTFAKDLIVTVRSWNQAQETAFTVEAKRAGAKNQKSGGKAQNYTYTFANLTKEQAQQKANSLLTQITLQERVITAEMPGDSILTMRQMIQLSGTGTSWDINYYPDMIERSITPMQGYRMQVRAKNHSPLSDEAE